MEVKTRLNVGDVLWIMYYNKPLKVCIESIKIYAHLEFDGFTNKTEVSIYYCGFRDVFRRDNFLYEENEIGKKAFLTKEDLINSLL